MYSNRFVYHLKDLQYEYTSIQPFQPTGKAFKNMPNKETFNKDNRYEVLLLINALQLEWGLTAYEDCRKIERLICTQMPDTVKSQIEVADWLVLNWNNFEEHTQTA